MRKEDINLKKDLDSVYRQVSWEEKEGRNDIIIISEP